MATHLSQARMRCSYFLRPCFTHIRLEVQCGKMREYFPEYSSPCLVFRSSARAATPWKNSEGPVMVISESSWVRFHFLTARMVSR